jgi:2-amino-4-hydroxy-6-hydroxymethyldihydropteridine diphosphokinase
METVYLLLGSNLGDRQGHLRICLVRLSTLGKITATSSIYETKAWGKQDQPDFLNQVVELKTNEDPDELLSLILAIELDMGRVRQEQWGSRIIDIDILLFGQLTLDTPRLKIPHPHLHQRRFALTPLTEIAPNFNHPTFRKTTTELLKQCSDTLEVKRFLTD